MNETSAENLDPRVALYEECENEPIHIPGSIQTYGALLAVDSQSGRIIQTSLNTQAYLGYKPASLLGCSIASIIGETAAAEIAHQNLVPHYPNLHKPVFLTLEGADNQPRDLIMLAHKNGDTTLLEFEASVAGSEAPMIAFHRLLDTLNSISQCRSESEFLQQAVTEIQALTRYERVMYYHFNNDGTGVVTHEVRSTDAVASYLDHHFPASDIPSQARELYRRNSLRFIFDTEAEPVPIEPVLNPNTGKPLDLSFSIFRSVSPVHVEYLRNMGVQASLSVSIVVDGQLEGLIACHHRTAKTVSEPARASCQTLSVELASHLARLRSVNESNWQNATRELLRPFINEVVRGQRFITSFRHHIGELLPLIDADAVFLQFGSEHVSVPKKAEKIPFPVELQEACQDQSILASDRLGAMYGLSQQQRQLITGGLLIDLGNGDFLCFGRQEYRHSVIWAGDLSELKQKNVASSGRLDPRNSFASWRETVRGKSRPFSAKEEAMARTLWYLLIEARALEFRRLAEEKLKTEADIDALTGLLNRKGFLKRGQEELERACRYGRTLALIYLDIDHFKRINDSLGHDAGDAVLRWLGDFFRERLRTNDICARQGGEEFVILLPETDTEAAVSMADSLRQQLEDHALEYNDGEIRFTCSFGVSVLADFANDTLDSLLKRADQALYQAKGAGRNRVMVN
ncbi:MAG: diguanylate cyclase [Gammaproteobacteria bacterium]